MEFKDIIGEKEEKDECVKPGVYTVEYDLSKIDDNIYYGDINLGTPKKIKEMVDVGFKVIKEFKKCKKELKEVKEELKISDNIAKSYGEQIDTLAAFLVNNFGEKICGGAVDTSISILSDIKSIEYNNGIKEIYENGVIVGANGSI